MDLKALWQLSYGMYIVCSKDASRVNGQIVNTAFQVSSEPATVSVSINKKNLTHELISSSKVFTVSTLAQDTPLTFIGQFGFKSGRDIDKLKGVGYRTGETGAPIVTDHTIGYIEAKVVGSVDVGSHTVFIGEVVGCECLSDKPPMTYSYYHTVVKGKTPKNAATFIDSPAKEASANMRQYKCVVCGYIYDPAKGDPDNGIKPGTAFESIPADWVCPVCGADKSQFEEVKE